MNLKNKHALWIELICFVMLSILFCLTHVWQGFFYITAVLTFLLAIIFVERWKIFGLIILVSLIDIMFDHTLIGGQIKDLGLCQVVLDILKLTVCIRYIKSFITQKKKLNLKLLVPLILLFLLLTICFFNQSNPLRILLNCLTLYVLFDERICASFVYLSRSLFFSIIAVFICMSCLGKTSFQVISSDLLKLVIIINLALIVLFVLRCHKKVCILTFFTLFMPILFFGIEFDSSVFLVNFLISVLVFILCYFKLKKFNLRSVLFVFVLIAVITVLVTTNMHVVNRIQNLNLMQEFNLISDVFLDCGYIALILFFTLNHWQNKKLKNYPIDYAVLEKVSISIIIPVYNGAKFVKRCIDKVLQINLNKEIIVINDGSTDGTLQILEEYAEKIVLINLDKNQGVSHARNLGLAKAKGDFIAFVDVDDDFELDMHPKILTKILHDKADVGICHCDLVDMEGLLISKTKFKFTFNALPQDEVIKRMLLGNIDVTAWTTVYKAELAKSVKFEDPIRVGEDRLYQLKIALRAKKTVFICEDLYHYVQNPESTLHSNTFLQKVLDYARLDEFLTETEKEKLMTSFPNEYKCFKQEIKLGILFLILEWRNYSNWQKQELINWYQKIFDKDICDYVLSDEKFDFPLKSECFIIKYFGVYKRFKYQSFWSFIANMLSQVLESINFLVLE